MEAHRRGGALAFIATMVCAVLELLIWAAWDRWGRTEPPNAGPALIKASGDYMC